MTDQSERSRVRADVAIVGAGPAGLAAAAELKRLGVKDVVVLERSDSAGGVPQMCHHIGFGVRDRHRVQSGPAYARSITSDAELAGVDIRLNSTVTGWQGPNALLVSSDQGLQVVEADAVLIATGARESNRSTAMVAGDRVGGVLTTGSLQRLVYDHKFDVGTRAVIVGAELVSFSALVTLRSAGVEVAAMITNESEVQLYSVLSPVRQLLSRLGKKFPLAPVHMSSEVVSVDGRGRVEAVRVRNFLTGREQTIECDTVVFTGGWRPEREVAVSAGVRLNKESRGPGINEQFMTSVPGVFAAGNVLRGVEQADYAAVEGKSAAESIKSYLSSGGSDSGPDRPIEAGSGVQWVVPDSWSGPNWSSIPILVRATEAGPKAELVVRQNGRLLYSRSLRHVPVNQTIRVPADWADSLTVAQDSALEVSIER